MWQQAVSLLAAALTLSVASAAFGAAGAGGAAGVKQETAELRAEVRQLRAQVDQMQRLLEALAARLGAPPAGAAGAPAAPLGGVAPPGGVTLGGAMARLIRPGPVSPAGRPLGYAGGPPQGAVVPGLEGVPKVFIPDIGAVGDFTLRQSDLRRGDSRFNPREDKFRVRDAQLIFSSPIDPYARALISIDKPDREPFDVEEAFVAFDKLPWGVLARAGQFRPRFGLLNGLDTFQLPMVNRPQALVRFIGEDGLVEPGVNLNAYIPNPWGADLKADFNIVSGRNPLSFNHRDGANFDFAYIGSLNYSRELFTTGFMNAGVSLAGGPGPGGQSYLQDAFLELQYSPTQRQVLSWRTESLLSERKRAGDRGVKRGLYSLLDYRFALRYHAALLVDMADRPGVARGTAVGFSPILSYFLSDNTRLRLQYTHTTPSGPERAQDAVFLQTTFSLGNLKPLE